MFGIRIRNGFEKFFFCEDIELNRIYGSHTLSSHLTRSFFNRFLILLSRHNKYSEFEENFDVKQNVRKEKNRFETFFIKYNVSTSVREY